MTYEQFIAGHGQLPWSAYVDHPEFYELYLRRGPVSLLADEKHLKVITIANIEAAVQGTGSFTRLANDLLNRGFTVVVENVLNKTFADCLRRAGWEEIPKLFYPNDPPSFRKNP